MAAIQIRPVTDKTIRIRFPLDILSNASIHLFLIPKHIYPANSDILTTIRAALSILSSLPAMLSNSCAQNVANRTKAAKLKTNVYPATFAQIGQFSVKPNQLYFSAKWPSTNGKSNEHPTET